MVQFLLIIEIIFRIRKASIEGTIAEEETKKYKLEYNPGDGEDPAGDIVPSDTAPPEISILSPEERDYTNDQILPLIYDISDDISPTDKINLTTTSCSESICEDISSQSQIDLSLENLGEHSIKITATDEAGNASEKEIKFQITTSLGAIRNNVAHFWDLELINTRYEKTYLLFKLRQLDELFNWLQQYENSNLGPAVKIFLTNSIKKTINFYINQLVYHISHVTPQLIDEQMAGFLAENLNFIRP